MGVRAAGRPKPGFERFVATLATDLPDAPRGARAHALATDCIRLKVRTIRRECGVRRLHDSHIAVLARHLKAASIHSAPALVPGLGSNDWVRFSRLSFREDTLSFAREDALKTLLADAIGSYGPLKDLRLLGEEYRLGTGRRCDFLCKIVRGSNRGGLVVVEAKRTTDERTAEQVIRYLDDLRQERISRGRKLGALVITGDADPAGVQALSNSTFPIQWYRYNVALEPVAQIGG